MMRLLPGLLFLLLSSEALAGAWTREAGGVQQISGVYGTQADHSFGSAGPISFLKVVAQTHTEYGATDWLTLVAATESAYVEITQPGLAPYSAFDQGVEVGARLRLRRGPWGVLTVEASYRSAAAFNFAVSANAAAPAAKKPAN